MDVETMDDLLSMEIEQKTKNNNNPSNNTINVSTQGLQQKMNFRKDENINYIYCPLCNTPIKPNPANMCIKCLNDQIDISDGISKQIILFDCRQCGRYYQNPQWIQCKLESPQLLQVCLKKVNGLKKVKLINAEFVWTEPHSRRIKVKLTIQKEVFNNAIIQKSFVVEYILANQQCSECQQSFTHHTWQACIQIRQKVEHKKTFLYLEQLILKHNMGQLCLGIKEQRDGIDFFFHKKSVMLTFTQFLHSVICIGTKESKKLISYDHKSNIAKYKYTMYGELPSVCRNDLVLIPINQGKLSNKLGGFCPLMICYKITKSLHFLDPTSLHTIELDNSQYFRYKFNAMSTTKHLSKFYVMKMQHIRTNKNRENIKNKKWKLCELELVRYDDLGNDDCDLLESITHLAGLLKEGDIVWGYDLKTLSVHNDLYNNKHLKKYLKKYPLPDVIVVKKFYEKRRRRKWELKTMVKDKDYIINKKLKEREEKDHEDFMRDLEEDFEYRCKINIFKKNKQKVNGSDTASSIYSGNNDDYAPTIPVHELITNFDRLDTIVDENVNNNDANNNDNDINEEKDNDTVMDDN